MKSRLISFTVSVPAASLMNPPNDSPLNYSFKKRLDHLFKSTEQNISLYRERVEQDRFLNLSSSAFMHPGGAAVTTRAEKDAGPLVGDSRPSVEEKRVEEGDSDVLTSPVPFASRQTLQERAGPQTEPISRLPRREEEVGSVTTWDISSNASDEALTTDNTRLQPYLRTR